MLMIWEFLGSLPPALHTSHYIPTHFSSRSFTVHLFTSTAALSGEDDGSGAADQGSTGGCFEELWGVAGHAGRQDVVPQWMNM
jgi:hypothetical protein